MQALLDSLIIETYTQLAVVLAVAATLVTAIVLVVRRRAARRRGAAKLAGTQQAPVARKSVRLAPQVRQTKGMDFNRLADMIANASDRAGRISETQSAAALKLDTAEMAVNRLIADIDPLMAVPKAVHPAPKDGNVGEPHGTIAA